MLVLIFYLLLFTSDAVLKSIYEYKTLSPQIPKLQELGKGENLIDLSHNAKKNNPKSSCLEMEHNNLYSHVTVEIGTDDGLSGPQKFSVIADTGSNFLVIPSCQCIVSGSCTQDQKCFLGTNRSSTFKIPPLKDLKGVKLAYGSGEITAVLSSDIIHVGGFDTMMENGLLLMVEQNLDFYGHSAFDGILGLGMPKFNDNAQEDAALSVHVTSFLENAHIDRFSICFLDGGKGKLILGTPQLDPKTVFTSIGQVHWGLGLHGISLGDSSPDPKMVLCNPNNLESDNQQTACGAIPDSGTSLMTAPKKQIMLLFKELCDKWDVCTAALENAAQNEQQIESQNEQQTEFQDEQLTEIKAMLFQKLVMGCEGLESLPPINYHLAGKEGKTRTFSIPANDYILQTEQPEVEHVKRWLLGLFPVDTVVETGKTKTVCMPAFSALEYTTEKNGPVWILGAQFFFNYVLSYDMSENAIGISEEVCACTESGKNLVSITERRGNKRLMKKVHNAPRFPHIDLNLPL